MSENENIDMNEYEDDNFSLPDFISMDGEEFENEKYYGAESMNRLTARHRIEEYFEAKHLREQITDPIYYL
jgi:hypothetical protein